MAGDPTKPANDNDKKIVPFAERRAQRDHAREIQQRREADYRDAEKASRLQRPSRQESDPVAIAVKKVKEFADALYTEEQELTNKVKEQGFTLEPGKSYGDNLCRLRDTPRYDLWRDAMAWVVIRDIYHKAYAKDFHKQPFSQKELRFICEEGVYALRAAVESEQPLKAMVTQINAQDAERMPVMQSAELLASNILKRILGRIIEPQITR